MVGAKPNHFAVAYRHCLAEVAAPADVAQYCLYSMQLQFCEHLRKRNVDSGVPSTFVMPSTQHMSDIVAAQCLANKYCEALSHCKAEIASLHRQLAAKGVDGPKSQTLEIVGLGCAELEVKSTRPNVIVAQSIVPCKRA